MSPEAARYDVSRFNNDMLRIARQSKNVTQKEISKSLGIHQSKVSKWEDGLIVPAADDLDRLGDFLEFPVEFFLQGCQVSGFGSCCLYHRKRTSITVRLLSTLHARINCLTIGIERLLKNAAVSPTVEFPNLDVDEFDSPEEVARMVRATWRIPLGPVKNLSHFVEAAGAVVVPVKFGTDKLDAVSLWPTRMLPLLFVNMAAPADRQRFNVAHEIGHLVMHRIPTPNAETEANRFASELLMPAREIKSELRGMTIKKAARLKLKWRTAMSSLILKARDTEAITPRKAKTLFSEMSRLGYRKVEPTRIDHDECKTLSKLIKAHRDKLKYSTKDLIKLTYCKTEDQYMRRYEPGNEKPLKIFR